MKFKIGDKIQYFENYTVTNVDEKHYELKGVAGNVRLVYHCLVHKYGRLAE